MKTVKTTKTQIVKEVTYMAVASLITMGIFLSYTPKDVSVKPQKAVAFTKPTDTPIPTPFFIPQGKEAIADYIREVFGQYADRAFYLLTCENSNWVTDIENNAGNTPADSYDVGLFQVNTHWQGVYNRAFLTDYRINTLMAYSIFSRDGYSFHQWTCGRKLGI